MSNMLADAAQNLANSLDDFASSLITYKRNSDSAAMLASVGNPEIEVEIKEDLGLAASMQVFIVRKTNLPAFASTPAVNDEIIYNGDTYRTFPFNGPFVWEKSDPFGVRIRIYTTKV